MSKAEWFVDWFDSPYYHLLYNHRDYEEAERFISRLCAHLQLKPGARIWDLACGKGRHSLAMNRLGYHVTGTDLSENSIRAASEQSNASLSFVVHDMRLPFRSNEFDAVFNLFTSIGYFENHEDNFLVFRNVNDALKPGGYFVVDFFNSEKVRVSPPVEQLEKRGHVTFDINKRVEGKSVVKKIDFHDKGKHYTFSERVSLLLQEDFLSLASRAGLDHLATFGSYGLEPFMPSSSNRMILIFKKPAA
jgi:SAM-dependent methyltransferase